MPKKEYVYMLASQRNGTLYVGVTSDLAKRVAQHKEDWREGFTKQYAIHHLVYFEEYSDIREALRREKQIKKWNRAWKLQLIEKENPDWRDLFDELPGYYFLLSRLRANEGRYF